MTRRRVRKSIIIALVTLGAGLASAVYTPQVLAFPYKAQFGETVVRSERPLPADFGKTIAAADALVAKSALYRGPVSRRIFLTDGGWRWRLMALRLDGTVAFTRPLGNLIVERHPDPGCPTKKRRPAPGGRPAPPGRGAPHRARR